jgi:nicotinate-nucleotide adenylyltransferase
MARAALDQLGLEQILWLPTGKPGYRRAPVASAKDRVAMLRLVMPEDSRYRIDERELDADATGYTVDTLGELGVETGQELCLLIGADQYAKFGTWHRPDEVRRLAQIAVFARPGIKIKSEPWMTLVEMPPLAISASAIRARAAKGEDLAGLVPPAVAAYISQHKLYR